MEKYCNYYLKLLKTQFFVILSEAKNPNTLITLRLFRITKIRNYSYYLILMLFYLRIKKAVRFSSHGLSEILTDYKFAICNYLISVIFFVEVKLPAVML